MEKIDKLELQILNIISKNANKFLLRIGGPKNAVFRVLPFINGYNA